MGENEISENIFATTEYIYHSWLLIELKNRNEIVLLAATSIFRRNGP
jgi:hypothetical protein